MYLIKGLLSGVNYYKEEFIKIIGEENYLAYLRIKRNKKELNNISVIEIKKLLNLSEKWLKELKD